MDKRITDREVFPAVCILIGILLSGYFIWKYFLGEPTISGCWIYSNLHVYCPGCGGTRALEALLQGKILRSFACHPAVPAAFIWVVIYLLSQVISRIRKGRGWALRYDDRWVVLFFGILVINCTIRNVLLLGFSITI